MNTQEESVCVWEERNEKKFIYIPKCLGTPVNIMKLSKRTNRTIASIMMKCPYCGRKTEFIFTK